MMLIELFVRFFGKVSRKVSFFFFVDGIVLCYFLSIVFRVSWIYWVIIVRYNGLVFVILRVKLLIYVDIF